MSAETDIADLQTRVGVLEVKPDHPLIQVDPFKLEETLNRIAGAAERLADIAEIVAGNLNLRYSGSVSLPVIVNGMPHPPPTPFVPDNSYKLDILSEAIAKLAMAFDPSLKLPEPPEPPMAPFEGR